MRILYHHRIASKDGQYVHVEELTNALLEAGNELHIVCPNFTDKEDFGGGGGLAAKLKDFLPKSVYELLELTYSAVIAVKLIVAILKFKPAVIYERYNLYQPAGVIVARIFRIPILLEVNAPLVQERAKYSGLALQKFAKFIENFTWKKSTYVLPVTEALAGYIRQSGVSNDKIVVIPNGINKQVLDELDARRNQRKSEDEIVIGFTGFINVWHRLDIALDAIAKLSDKRIRFLCVGEGNIRPTLEKQADDLGISDQVSFIGLVSRKEVLNYVSHFDIALQPSVTSYASPLKLFEYLACSCLVIAPDMPNIREILSDKEALLFNPENKDEFGEKLVYALEHYEELANMRVAARELIDKKNLTWQQNAAKVVAIVEKKTINVG